MARTFKSATAWGDLKIIRSRNIHEDNVTAPAFAVDQGAGANWRVGQAIAAVQVPAAEGNPTPKYTAAGLPAGIAFDAATRRITGTPTGSGSGTITITATNSFGSDDWTMEWAAVVGDAAPHFSTDTGTAQAWIAGTPIDTLQVPFASGHPAPVYAAAGLPDGVDFNAATRQITGTPTGSGSGTITITARNSEGDDTWTVKYEVSGSAVPKFPGAKLVRRKWLVNTAIDPITVPEASGHPAPVYTAEGLPGDLVFDAATRQIAGQPKPRVQTGQDMVLVLESSTTTTRKFSGDIEIDNALLDSRRSGPTRVELTVDTRSVGGGDIAMTLNLGGPDRVDLSPAWERSGRFFIQAADSATSIQGDDIETSGDPYTLHITASVWAAVRNAPSITLRLEDATATSNYSGKITARATNDHGEDAWVLEFEVSSQGAAPGFLPDSVPAQTWELGDEIVPILLNQSVDTPTVNYEIIGALPDGLKFDPETLEISGTVRAVGSGRTTIRATNSQGTDDWTMDWTVRLQDWRYGGVGGSLLGVPAGRTLEISARLVSAGFSSDWTDHASGLLELHLPRNDQAPKLTVTGRTSYVGGEAVSVMVEYELVSPDTAAQVAAVGRPAWLGENHTPPAAGERVGSIVFSGPFPAAGRADQDGFEAQVRVRVLDSHNNESSLVVGLRRHSDMVISGISDIAISIGVRRRVARLEVSGGVGPYAWSLGNPPAGVTLVGEAIYAEIDRQDQFTVTVQVRDSRGSVVSDQFTITVGPVQNFGVDETSPVVLFRHDDGRLYMGGLDTRTIHRLHAASYVVDNDGAAGLPADIAEADQDGGKVFLLTADHLQRVRDFREGLALDLETLFVTDDNFAKLKNGFAIHAGVVYGVTVRESGVGEYTTTERVCETVTRCYDAGQYGVQCYEEERCQNVQTTKFRWVWRYLQVQSFTLLGGAEGNTHNVETGFLNNQAATPTDGRHVYDIRAIAYDGQASKLYAYMDRDGVVGVYRLDLTTSAFGSLQIYGGKVVLIHDRTGESERIVDLAVHNGQAYLLDALNGRVVSLAV